MGSNTFCLLIFLLPTSFCVQVQSQNSTNANFVMEIVTKAKNSQNAFRNSEELRKFGNLQLPLQLVEVDSIGLELTDETNIASEESFDRKGTPLEVWGYSLVCMTIINCCAFLGAFVAPFTKRPFYKYLLNVLFGLGVGSVMGSAFFHLLPETFGLDHYDPDGDYLFRALVIFGGIWMFFIVERVLKIVIDYNQRTAAAAKMIKRESVLSHVIARINQSQQQPSTVMVIESDLDRNKNDVTGNVILSDISPLDNEKEDSLRPSFGYLERQRLSGVPESLGHMDTENDGKQVIATVAWMITFGDGFHNIFDGQAIGAAFENDLILGFSLVIAIFCQELPHELGDFAILMNAGMTMRQAIKYNFLSASTSYFGLVAGILLGQIDAEEFIFAMAAGTLLYLGLVDMLPAMNELADETSKTSVKKALTFLLLQNIGILIGVSALFVLAVFGGNINIS